MRVDVVIVTYSGISQEFILGFSQEFLLRLWDFSKIPSGISPVFSPEIYSRIVGVIYEIFSCDSSVTSSKSNSSLNSLRSCQWDSSRHLSDNSFGTARFFGNLACVVYAIPPGIPSKIPSGIPSEIFLKVSFEMSSDFFFRDFQSKFPEKLSTGRNPEETSDRILGGIPYEG